jgi:hypothetical protein
VRFASLFERDGVLAHEVRPALTGLGLIESRADGGGRPNDLPRQGPGRSATAFEDLTQSHDREGKVERALHDVSRFINHIVTFLYCLHSPAFCVTFVLLFARGDGLSRRHLEQADRKMTERGRQVSPVGRFWLFRSQRLATKVRPSGATASEMTLPPGF